MVRSLTLEQIPPNSHLGPITVIWLYGYYVAINRYLVNVIFDLKNLYNMKENILRFLILIEQIYFLKCDIVQSDLY